MYTTIHGYHGALLQRLFSMIYNVRNRHLFIMDTLVFMLTPFLALIIRTESLDMLAMYSDQIFLYALVSLMVKLTIFYASGVYHRYWLLADIRDVAHLAVPLAAIVAADVAFSRLVLRPLGLMADIPHFVSFIDGMLTVMAVGGIRLALRLAFSLKPQTMKGTTDRWQRTLIAGAGEVGSTIAKEMRRMQMKPVGFVDDDARKQRIRLHGVPVLGTLDDLSQVVRNYNVDTVVIAMPNAPGRVVRNLLEACKQCGVRGKTVPGLFDILDGRAQVSELRDIQIEDLLRRGAIRTDCSNVRDILHGKRVLVSGAGGSIGSELCRQILAAAPSELVLLGHGENSIFQTASLLRRSHPDGQTRLCTVIADIRDTARVRRVFARHRPEIVFHAAAHKHVGLMEVNVPDAVTNNVFGTYTLLQLSTEFNVERFVMISSDKAVYPTSIMGVTKRVAELLVRDAAIRTCRPYVVVRFGNVLGSRGSVVPIFQRQIAQGGPVTVTHPEATRYFMTIPEAVQLVLQAAGLGKGGGETFVLDMGEPIRIVDLARDVIRLCGLEEGSDVEIVFSGLQRGEKMHEELFYAWEEPERTSNDKVFVCRNGAQRELKRLLNQAGVSSTFVPGGETPDHQQCDGFVRHLAHLAELGDVESISRSLKMIVPEYMEGGAYHEQMQMLKE